MTANDLAKLITKREGKRLSISIAQVKEVLRVTAELCGTDKLAAHAFVTYCATRAKAAKRKAAKVETRLHKRLKKR